MVVPPPLLLLAWSPPHWAPIRAALSANRHTFVGITGVKPTYGSISRYGMIAFASSLDQAGPMARTVDDCALLLDAMIEQDPRDSTTNPRKVESLADLDPSDLKGLKVGLPKEYLAFDLNQDVKDQF